MHPAAVTSCAYDHQHSTKHHPTHRRHPPTSATLAPPHHIIYRGAAGGAAGGNVHGAACLGLQQRQRYAQSSTAANETANSKQAKARLIKAEATQGRHQVETPPRYSKAANITPACCLVQWTHHTSNASTPNNSLLTVTSNPCLKVKIILQLLC